MTKAKVTISGVRIMGIRCLKCKKELSHVVNEKMPQGEAMIRDAEVHEGIRHRDECDGVVERFEVTE